MIPSSPEKKRVVVILNGISLRKKIFYHRFFPMLNQLCDVEVVETLSKNDAVSLASKSANQYVDLIIAAGGDGTLNQVVNGILNGRENEMKLPVIGFIPIGSGNDFARTFSMKADPEQLKKLLIPFQPKKIDVGKIRFTAFPDSAHDRYSSERFFVNVADIGMGPVVVDKVLKSTRSFGQSTAYYKSILATFLSYKSVVVKATAKEWNWEGKLRTLGVANGKYYGHGLCIAPEAVPDDRVFDVFICGNVSVFDFMRYSGRMKKGKHIRIPEIQYKRTSAIAFTSEKPCMIEGDGEILGLLPASVDLFERQLDFLI